MANVAVFGCGPAGLFAAHALKMHGFKPTIISKKQKSVIYGAQYLHRPIPGLSDSAATADIRTILAGVPEVYAERVYGLATMPTSWHRVVPYASGWDLRETYDVAWDKYSHEVIDWILRPDEIEEWASQFDLVISTVPLWSICLKPNEHYFRSVNILVQKDVDLKDAVDGIDDNFVVYNGTWEHAWYRASSIFGHTSVEARSEEHLLRIKKWEPGFKVVGTDCDCHPTLRRAGRMGTWRRGVLTHHVFEQTCAAIADQFGSMRS